MPSANCFDAPTLKDYLLGRLSEAQSDVVAAHLEACLLGSSNNERMVNRLLLRQNGNC